MKKHLATVLVLLSIVLLSLAGCSRDNDISSPELTTAPPLPSAFTMSMNLSIFESAPVDAQAIEAGRYEAIDLAEETQSKLHFLNAAVRVHILNLVVYVALIQPVAAFTLAAHSVPQPQSDGSWLWTYIFVDGATEYSIFLNGKNMGSYTRWKLEVSSNDPAAPLDHFLWFEGEVQKDETYGYWQFYEPTDELVTAMVAAGVLPYPAAMRTGTTAYGASVTRAAGSGAPSTGQVLSTPGVQSIRIDWENRPGNEHELVFLVNKPGVPEEGSTLTYSESPSVSSVDFYDSKTGNSGIIMWYPNGSGSIEWPDYRNGEKCCWDTHQYNTVCPE